MCMHLHKPPFAAWTNSQFKSSGGHRLLYTPAFVRDTLQWAVAWVGNSVPVTWSGTFPTACEHVMYTSYWLQVLTKLSWFSLHRGFLCEWLHRREPDAALAWQLHQGDHLVNEHLKFVFSVFAWEYVPWLHCWNPTWEYSVRKRMFGVVVTFWIWGLLWSWCVFLLRRLFSL